MHTKNNEKVHHLPQKRKEKGESMDDWFPLPKCKLSKYYFKTM